MTHIEQRYGPAAEWTAVNPVLHVGEAGHESDTGKWKLGDGVTDWNALPYKSGVDSVAGKTGAVTLTASEVGAAPLNSPGLTGTPTAPTPSTSSNTNRIATTAFVRAQQYAPRDSPSLLGTPTAPTPATADNSSSIATTAFVKAQPFAPIDDAALTGEPTAPTPANYENSDRIATTAFVKAQAQAWGPYIPVITPWTLHADQKWFRYTSDGQTLKVQGAFVALTYPGGTLTIGLPDGIIGYTGSVAQYRAVGTWTALRQEVTRKSDVLVLAPTGDSLLFQTSESGPFFVDHQTPVVWQNADVFTFAAEFEIA